MECLETTENSTNSCINKTYKSIMKLKKHLSLCLLVSFVFFSCNQKERSPKSTLIQWLKFRSKGDCKKAQSFELFTLRRPVIDTICEPFQLEVYTIKCEISGETSNCTSCEKRNNGKVKTYNYSLKKVDAEWRVSKP